MRDDIESWLKPFSLHDALCAHAADVLCALPADVREDLIGDPAFVICDYEPGREPVHVPLRLPTGSRRGPGRAVVLKRSLLRRPVEFVRWVIAHELAHAHLRNGGRYPGEDPEHAADALAAGWGFPKPSARPLGSSDRR